MRIKIVSIRAVIVNASTVDEDRFLINHWEVEYKATLGGTLADLRHGDNEIEGYLVWLQPPEIEPIMKYIRNLFKQ